MKLSDFDYYLPPELIATEPAKKRDQSRLLVLDKKTGAIAHKHFFDLPDYLQPGDLLIANNSKVIPARLIGKKSTGLPADAGHSQGGEVEVLLSKHTPASGHPSPEGNNINVWECLIKGRVKVGTKIIFSKKLSAVVEKISDNGVRFLRFNLSGHKFMKEVEAIGHIPLPPYIIKQREVLCHSDDDESRRKNPNVEGILRRYAPQDDRRDYQTVYAQDLKKGSVAAPTAGLHFTPELIKKIKAKGVGVEYLTLHVGLGTFLPVKTEKIEEHKIHSEYAEIPQKTLQAIMKAKMAGKKVVAVGTTTARTLEFFARDINPTSDVRYPICGMVDIFIYPPFEFKVVDALITNFHLPKSTLLMLVSALAGKQNIDRAYQEAIKAKYRFYSYGDAMLII